MGLTSDLFDVVYATDIDGDCCKTLELNRGSAVHDDAAEWGDALWGELDRRFRAMQGTGGAHGLSADLLLGGAAELADRCKAWFTDRFDAQAELNRLKEGGIAS